MFCPKCGKEVPDGAAHCPNCGQAVQVTQVSNAAPMPPVQPSKKKGKKKWIIIGVVVVILVIMMFGGGSDSSSTPPDTGTPTASNTTTQDDANQPAEDSKDGEDSKDTTQTASALEQYRWIAENASTTFSIPDQAAAFITAHPDFFPGNSSNTGAMSDSTTYDVTYPMLAKSAKKYSDKLFNVYGVVTDVDESDDGSITYIHIQDYDSNSYIAYYLGSIDIFEKDTVTGYLLPLDNIQFENVGGGYTDAVVFAAAYLEKQEINDIG